MKRKEIIRKEAKCIYDGGYCFYDSIVNKNSMSVLSLLLDMVIDHDDKSLDNLNYIIEEKKEELDMLEDYQKYNYAVAIRNSLVHYIRSEEKLEEAKKEEAIEDLRNILKYFKEPKNYPEDVYQNTYNLVKEAEENNRPYKIFVKQF